jgi:hypothetical protein
VKWEPPNDADAKNAALLESERIRLEALERHIQDALRKEGLPRLHRWQFTRHLARVQAARERLNQIQ